MKSTAPVILITRPEPGASRFRDQLRAELGDSVRIVLSPVMRVVPCELPSVWPEDTGFIFTSGAGVARLAAGGGCVGARAWCVGDTTARLAQEAGMIAASAGGAADDLVQLVLKARPPGPLFHIAGRDRRGEVAGRLAAAGLDVQVCIGYESQPQPLNPEAASLLSGETPLLLPLFSPRSASLLQRAASDARAPLIPVAISAATAAAWGGAGCEIAPHPDGEAMKFTVLEKLRGQQGC